MSENRGYWYLLTGLLIGVALGVAYAWLVAPLEYIDTSPDSLRADFKDEYRFLIAASYQTHGNLERTQARLTLLGDTDPAVALGEQAQRMLASNAPMNAIRPLADLAEALQNPIIFTETPAVGFPLAATMGISPVSTSLANPSAVVLPTDATSPFEPILEPSETPLPEPTITYTPTLRPGARTATATRTPLRSPTPIATATLRPSLTPTATAGLPFQLIDQATFCEPQRPGLLQVFLENSAGNPASGIEISITWLGGEEEFFTGLKPELGYGYADFQMTASVEYVLSLSNGVTRISGLQAPICSADGIDYPGGIRLDFQQP